MKIIYIIFGSVDYFSYICTLIKTLENMKHFKEGLTVTVDDCYLNDECTENINPTKTATVITEPRDEEELVCIVYENGVIDYVPQDILEINYNIIR